MDSKLIGSILLIVGTSVGAGMLALPIATAQLGFIGSLVLLVSAWFVMTAGALCILEAILWLPLNSNIISMAKATIGPVGQIIAWCTYLLLLYSVQSAYIAGGSDLFRNLLNAAGFDISASFTAILFTLILGFIIYLGIRTVDYANRVFMTMKLGAYLLLVILLIPFISLEKLVQGDMVQMSSTTAIMVTIISFGYAAIVPSLRIYFNGDVVKLKKAIFIGSLIPLVCYIFWDMVIMGVIPLDGTHGLIAILQSKNSTSDLANTLSAAASMGVVTFFTKLFTSIAVLSSFVGVGLCLSDFLADGLQLEKKGKSQLIIYSLTFLPSLGIVLFYPGLFVKALKYAGIYCLVLLVLLPAWMVWNGRYRRHFVDKGYRLPGGKALLLGLMLLSVVLFIKSIISELW